jgi:ketoreductase RED2
VTPATQDPFSFEGQVVIVTGSSSGIGDATARAFAARGAKLVVNSSSSRSAGERLAADLPDAIYVQADISREAQAKKLIEAAAARYGRLDHVINNAGTTKVIPHADLDAATDEVWRRILDVNLLGTWYMCRAAVPLLRHTGGGSIINVTSIAGLRQTGSSIPYAVSKAAVNHLTRLLANQLGPEVRVNAVAPGLIATPWTADWNEIHRRVADTAPLRRSGTPEDIAIVCLALAASRYTTGAIITADGGMSLRA